MALRVMTRAKGSLRDRLGCRLTTLMLAGLLLVGGAAAQVGNNPEVVLPEAEFARLDTFEAHSLQKADKAFPSDIRKANVRDLRAAAAAYDSFVIEFPRSKAVPYALLRKGRCLHLEDKRHEAIKAYTEVLDYFPNDIPYASAALYYIGECHWQNGREDDALKAWAEMAEDADYSKTRFAATAINKLADALAARDEMDRAVKYWRQLALEFRNANRDEANDAIGKVVRYHIRIKPDEAALRSFYQDARGIDDRPKDVPSDLLSDGEYWSRVRQNVWRHQQFPDDQAEQAKLYFAYWAQQMQGRFPKDDGYQLDRLSFQRRADGNRDAWVKGVDAQFAVNMKPGNFDHIIRWIRIYREEPAKVEEYYQKIDFSKMSNDQIRSLMDTAYSDLKNPELGKRVFQQTRFDELDDRGLINLARAMWHRDVEAVERTTARISDKALGKMELLRFYDNKKMHEKGLPLAIECTSFPDYANEAYWIKAIFHKQKKEYAEAIAAFQTYRPKDEGDPENLFQIADCYDRMGRLNSAVQQLEEIEGFFEKHAPEAALRIATLYGKNDLRDKNIAKLRVVLSKYPNASQSREAHFRLEKMGLSAIIGGSVGDPDAMR